MAIYKELSLYDFEKEFRNYHGRDQFSNEAYKFLYEYYDECGSFVLDTAEVCGEWTEYNSYDEMMSALDFNKYGIYQFTYTELPNGHYMVADFNVEYERQRAMSFWRVEVYRNNEFHGTCGDFDNYHYAIKVAKAYLDDDGRSFGYHCVVVKCGGTPLQCCIDGTVAHYVY